MNVVVVGQGYVGLPLAMESARAGHATVGVDLDDYRVRKLKAGESYVLDIPDSELKGFIAAGLYRPEASYDEISDFDVAVITVPTPLEADGESPNLTYIRQSTQSLSTKIKPGCLVILESTTFPGTTEEIVIPILESGSGLSAGTDFFVAYSPERIDPGNQKWNFSNTPKLVAGVNEDSQRAAERFYQGIGVEVIPVTGIKEAEFAKLLENTFRHVNIALVNELSQFAQPLGIDIREVIRAAATKPFGFMPFWPGPGVGGHCLPDDSQYLRWYITEHTGEEPSIIRDAVVINREMPAHVARLASDVLAQNGISLEKATIAVFGLAYKADSNDTRNSPGLSIAQILQQSGATVFGVDDHISAETYPPGVHKLQAAEVLGEHCDLIVVTVNHSHFDFTQIEQSGVLVLDTCGALSSRAASG